MNKEYKLFSWDKLNEIKLWWDKKENRTPLKEQYEFSKDDAQVIAEMAAHIKALENANGGLYELVKELKGALAEKKDFEEPKAQKKFSISMSYDQLNLYSNLSIVKILERLVEGVEDNNFFHKNKKNFIDIAHFIKAKRPAFLGDFLYPTKISGSNFWVTKTLSSEMVFSFDVEE